MNNDKGTGGRVVGLYNEARILKKSRHVSVGDVGFLVLLSPL